MSVECIQDHIHIPLNRGEQVCLLGGLIVSPIHTALSVIQIAAGIIMALICTILRLSVICSKDCGEFFEDQSKEGIKHIIIGCGNMTTSIMNIITLGALGCAFKDKILVSLDTID